MSRPALGLRSLWIPILTVSGSEDGRMSSTVHATLRSLRETGNCMPPTHRALHSHSGACSVFRTFQGCLSMFEVLPGEGSILFALAEIDGISTNS